MWCPARVSSENAPPSRWTGIVVALVIVAAAWAVLQLWGLERMPFHTHGEPREAIVVQDLVQRQHWILPRRNAVTLPRKPPLFYWLAGLSAHALGGVDERSIRLPSAVQSGAATLLVTGATAALFGPPAGAAAGLVLLSSFEWLRAATSARVDMTLTFGLTAVFVGLLLFRHSGRRIWRLLFYAGAAWATLAKGIPGLAIPTLQVALLCVLDRSLQPLRQLRPLLGLPIVVIIAGAWYVAAAAEGGRAFLTIVANENLVRIVGADAAHLGHAHGVGYLVGALLAGLLPWTLLLPAVAVALWRARSTIDHRDPRLFALLWSVAVFAPYAVASSKRGVYLLALYPAVALLIGWWAQRVWRGATEIGALRTILAVLLWPLALLCALLAFAALGERAGLPLLAWLPDLAQGLAAAHIEAIVAACGAADGLFPILLAVAAVAAITGALAAGPPRPRLVLAALFGLTGALVLVVRLVAMPAIAGVETRRALAAALRATLPEGAIVHTVPTLDYGLLYYWGGAMPVYDPSTDGEPPAVLVMPEATWLRAPATLRDTYERRPGLPTPHGAPAVLQPRAAASTH